MQFRIKGRLHRCYYVLRSEIGAVRELHSMTQIECNAPAIFVDSPLRREFRLVLLSFAIDANEHAAREITDSVGRFFFGHERVQSLGITFDCDAQLAAILYRAIACRREQN